jgi:hypothetical protein
MKNIDLQQNKSGYANSVVPKAVSMKNTIFWDDAPSCTAEVQ